MEESGGGGRRSTMHSGSRCCCDDCTTHDTWECEKEAGQRKMTNEVREKGKMESDREPRLCIPLSRPFIRAAAQKKVINRVLQ